MNLPTFLIEYQLALDSTFRDPKKWLKFSESVRKDSKQSDEELRRLVRNVLDRDNWAAKELGDIYKTSIDGGPGRLDALNGIGNLIFGSTLKTASNFHSLSAPASIPFLWDIWKFDWMHYNSSFSQPMAQNGMILVVLRTLA